MVTQAIIKVTSDLGRKELLKDFIDNNLIIRFVFWYFSPFAKLRARRRGPGYFSSYSLRRRSFCCVSSFFSMAVPVQPDPAALAALQNLDLDPQAPAGKVIQNPIRKLPLHKLLVKCKR